jgi:hypothetical protein
MGQAHTSYPYAISVSLYILQSSLRGRVQAHAFYSHPISVSLYILQSSLLENGSSTYKLSIRSSEEPDAVLAALSV